MFSFMGAPQALPAAKAEQPPEMSALPLLSDLIAQHSKTILAIRQHSDCAALLQKEHDDIFVVRYVLSNKGDVAKSAGAIRQAILWRREHAQLLGRIDELQEEVRTIIPTAMLPWRTRQGQPIQLAIPFAVDVSTWSSKSEQWHHEAGISNREVAYRVCDQLSRQSGRLVKLVMIQDLTGLSLAFAMQNSKLVQNQGKLSKLAEFLFPQLIEMVLVTHPPSFIQTLYRMATAVLSERLVAKVKMTESAEKLCAYAHVGMDAVPTFLGGLREYDAEWVPVKMREHHDAKHSSRRTMSIRGPPSAAQPAPVEKQKSGGSSADSSKRGFNPFAAFTGK